LKRDRLAHNLHSLSTLSPQHHHQHCKSDLHPFEQMTTKAVCCDEDDMYDLLKNLLTKNNPLNKTGGDRRPAEILVVLGAIALAIEPVLWLVRTWTEPAYDSPGGWIFALAAGLFCWSVTSAKTHPAGATKDASTKHASTKHASTKHAWWLLMATAVLRLVGQVLAINVIGALALAVDVYAIGILSGLSRRKRSVSPFWLAASFAFSLPVERIFQRLIGYGLQHLSAAGSCSLLDVFFDNVTCAGVHIQLAGQDVLVDLPCSGARGLVLLSVLFCGLAAIARPSIRQALVGMGLAMISALVANSLRIAALAVGIAFPETVGVDVMVQPWHDIVGLAALAVGIMPLVWWARSVRGGARSAEGTAQPARTPNSNSSPKQKAPTAILFIICTLAVIFAPQNPVDVAKRLDTIALPSTLGGHPAARQPLSELEQDYFTRFGGAAAKASYGPHTLLVVQTSAPLRHLHAPDECLSGAGFSVETAGITGQALPGATYRATAPNGSQWRVVVTYVSDSGAVATSISEAIWRWMQNTDSTWTAIERFHPAHAPLEQAEAFDENVRRAFDLDHRGQDALAPKSTHRGQDALAPELTQ
jgi:exosortase/archaeosortase family protein